MNKQAYDMEKTGTLAKLQECGLWNEGQKLRLHLGCGSIKLADYINIDFPPTEHTVQTSSGADFFGDILKLTFPPDSVDEIRLHHVFEHFDRPTAIGQLYRWHFWLKIGGILTIETPDLSASLWMLILPWYSYKTKQVVIRHLFGSHEAHWAYHYDAWNKEKYMKALKAFGFGSFKFKYTSYKSIRNIQVSVIKLQTLSSDKLFKEAKDILRYSLVDKSDTEKRLFNVWLDKFNSSLNIS
jgi:predicted SAM-dependent methyltransferase